MKSESYFIILFILINFLQFHGNEAASTTPKTKTTQKRTSATHKIAAKRTTDLNDITLQQAGAKIPTIIAIQIINSTSTKNVTASKNSKRTIESYLGYGSFNGNNINKPQAKFEIYPYSQHDIPPSNPYSEYSGLGKYSSESSTTLFATVNPGGHIGPLSNKLPVDDRSIKYIPVIVLKIHSDQLNGPGGLYPSVPATNPYSHSINMINLQPLLTSYIQNHQTLKPTHPTVIPKPEKSAYHNHIHQSPTSQGYTSENYPDEAHTRIVFPKRPVLPIVPTYLPSIPNIPKVNAYYSIMRPSYVYTTGHTPAYVMAAIPQAHQPQIHVPQTHVPQTSYVYVHMPTAQYTHAPISYSEDAQDQQRYVNIPPPQQRLVYFRTAYQLPGTKSDQENQDEEVQPKGRTYHDYQNYESQTEGAKASDYEVSFPQAHSQDSNDIESGLEAMHHEPATKEEGNIYKPPPAEQPPNYYIYDSPMHKQPQYVSQYRLSNYVHSQPENFGVDVRNYGNTGYVAPMNTQKERSPKPIQEESEEEEDEEYTKVYNYHAFGMRTRPVKRASKRTV